MLDSYWKGPVLRISPEAPVPVVRVEEQESRIGGAGNVALNATLLGARTHLLGLIGQDTSGDQIEQILRSQKVESKLQRVSGSKTITKLRILSGHQQLIRLDFEDNFINWETSVLERDFIKLLKRVDVVVFSDYGKGVLLNPNSMIKIARDAGKTVIIDPKGTDFKRYEGANIITPNLGEFEAVVGQCNSDDEIEERGIALRESLKSDALLITRSEKGMTLLARNRAPLHLPARAQEVFDVTGAGDTVVATLGAAMAAGANMPDAVIMANEAAGLVVSKLGTASVSPKELQRSLNRSYGIHNARVYGVDELQEELRNMRAEGEQIVMTNGCFDILHPGHIDYLEKARSLGDKLIVAVNDDDSVQRLKGPGRPINSLANRIRMLAALSCVDLIVAFSEDTPEQLYSQVLPDVLVKGGDYTESQVVGGDCIKAAGGKVKIIDYLDGYSTTNLLKRIQKNLR